MIHLSTSYKLMSSVVTTPCCTKRVNLLSTITSMLAERHFLALTVYLKGGRILILL